MEKRKDNMLNRQFGNRVAQLRNENKYTQVEFADILGLSPSYISLIEAGRRTPTLQTIVQLSNILNISLDYLILGSDDGSKYSKASFSSANTYLLKELDELLMNPDNNELRKIIMLIVENYNKY